MTAAKITDNLKTSFLLAREFKLGWAIEPVIKGPAPSSWIQAQAWFDVADAAAKRHYEEVRDALAARESERIARAGGWVTGVRQRGPDHLPYGAGDPPSPQHIHEDGDYSWVVDDDGNMIMSSWGEDPKGVRWERARLTVPAKGEVVLIIYEGAERWHLHVLRRAALALGETPTVEMLDAHIAKRPQPRRTRSLGGGYGGAI